VSRRISRAYTVVRYAHNCTTYYVLGLTTSSSELNPKNSFGNLALHSVNSSGDTPHSLPAS
jgi:hypothetical protein